MSAEAVRDDEALARHADRTFKRETYDLMRMLGRQAVEKELRQRKRYAANRETAPDARERQLHLIEIIREVLEEVRK